LLIIFIGLFIEFDNLVDDKSQQKKLLEKLAGPKYLKLGLKYMNHKQEGTSEGSKSEAEEESRKSTLVYSHEDHYKESLKKIQNETASLSDIHPSLVNRIDYKSLSDSYFQSFLKGYPHISDITEESFITKVAECIDAEHKKSKGEPMSITMSVMVGDSGIFYKS
jgi:hypothetical protein